MKLIIATIITGCTVATAGAQSIQTSIQLAGIPEQVAVNYITDRIYVAVPSNTLAPDSLAVINGQTNEVVDTVTLPGNTGYAVAVDSVRNRVYVGGCYPNAGGTNVCEVTSINGTTNKVIGTVLITNTPGFGIEGVAVDQATGTTYISNASDNVVDVISCNSETISTTIPLGGLSPAQLAVNPLTSQLYVVVSTNLVDVINTRTNTITATTTVGQSNQGIAVNWATGHVFVTNDVFGISTTGVLNSTGTVLANVTVGNSPFGVDVDPLSNLAFVVNTEDYTLSVINGATNLTTTTLPVAGTFVAANPTTRKVYVSGQSNELIVIDENN
jgi:DNA-binding beta-propeller fold protein YncE